MFFHIKIIFSNCYLFQFIYNIICFGVFFMAGKSYIHVSLMEFGQRPGI
jgi:hypothetical protein